MIGYNFGHPLIDDLKLEVKMNATTAIRGGEGGREGGISSIIVVGVKYNNIESTALGFSTVCR